MASRLIQILTFTNVAGGGQVTLPHSLNVMGRAVTPDIVQRDNANFTVDAVTTTTVTVTNTSGALATLNLWLEFKHTILREFGSDATTQLTPAPFVPAVGSSGSGTLALADRRTLHFLAASPGFIGADGGAPYFSQSRLYADGGSWDNLAPADFTGRQLDPATHVVVNAAGTPNCVCTALFADGFAAGNTNITGADAALWTPGGGSPIFFIMNGVYGNAMDNNSLISTITIKNEDALSLAVNRFTLPGGTDIVLAYGQGIGFRYDAGTTRWVPVIAS